MMEECSAAEYQDRWSLESEECTNTADLGEPVAEEGEVAEIVEIVFAVNTMRH